MKYAKMLGLAVVAAAALMAFVGAGSASADVICATNTTPCSSINGAGTTYSATLKAETEATLSAGFSTIKCKESAVEVEQTSAGGAAGVAVEGKINSLSFGNCNATVNVLALGSGQVSYTSEMNGSITGSGTKVELVAGTTKCFYGGSITEGLAVNGGAPATGKATNVKLAREAGSSALCANPAKWNAEYVFAQTAYGAAS